MALAQSLRDVAATGALVVRQRLELAAIDVEDELQSLARLFAGVLALWDIARVAAIVGLALADLAGAVLAWQRLLRAWAAKPPFMAATVEELRRDGRQLSP